MFNNDWDTTYAIIMLATLALSKAGSTEAKIQRIIKEFIQKLDQKGYMIEQQTGQIIEKPKPPQPQPEIIIN